MQASTDSYFVSIINYFAMNNFGRCLGVCAKFRHCGLLKSNYWTVSIPHNGKVQLFGGFHTSACHNLENHSDLNDALSHEQPDLVEGKKVHNHQFPRKRPFGRKAKEKYFLGQSVFVEDTSGAEEITQGSRETKEIEDLLKNQESSDRFGELAAESDPAFRTQLYREDTLDEEEEEFHRPLVAQRRNKVPWWYGRRIEKLLAEGKIREAIAVLEDQMLVKDRIRPTEYCFTALIGGLGRVGYTKKAFSLFNQMKKMGVAPSEATYTALFNACSNSPFRDGLQRAAKLRALMKEKDVQPNLINYKTMIKAFGKGGDLLTAFSLVDELCEHFKPDEEIYSALLIACVSDREAGFKHAIEVWRRQRKSGLPFNLVQYNLLLRAVRDCGLGGEEYMQSLLRPQAGGSRQTQDISSKEHLKISSAEPRKLSIKRISWGRSISASLDNMIALPQVSHDECAASSDMALTSGEQEVPLTDPDAGRSSRKLGHRIPADQGHSGLSVVAAPGGEKPSSFSQGLPCDQGLVPNILNPRGVRGVVRLSGGHSPSQRFKLLGGLPGVLSHMGRDGVAADIKTFTLCLELIPHNCLAENDLVQTAVESGVTLDTDFHNLLIRRRNKRGDVQGAQAVLEEISARNLAPNIMTFGCLAIGCDKKSAGLTLLEDMKKAGFTPNMTIYNTLSWKSGIDYHYKTEILKSMKANDIQPNRNFLKHMETALETGRQNLYKLEHGEAVPDYVRSPIYAKGVHNFRLYYKQWLQSMGVQEEEHPWTSYRKSPSQGPDSQRPDAQG